MKRFTRILAGAVALGAVAAAPVANADQGNTVIDSKQDGEVVLGGTNYRVSATTVLEDKDGQAITFAALPSLAQGASTDDAAVWFESTDTEAQTPVLHLLKLTGSVPR